MSNNVICIDANFIVYLVTSKASNSPFVILWEEWKASQSTLVAPTLFYYEVTNALYRISRSGQMNMEEAKESLNDALNFEINLYGHHQLPKLHQKVVDLANQFNLSATYDAHYLALAESLNCEFYTGDKRLYNIVKNSLKWVHLVH